jgi:hypothetical protein
LIAKMKPMAAAMYVKSMSCWVSAGVMAFSPPCRS